MRERFRRAEAALLESFRSTPYRLEPRRPRWRLIAAAVGVLLIIFLPLAGLAEWLRLVRDGMFLAVVNAQTLFTAFILLFRPRERGLA